MTALRDLLGHPDPSAQSAALRHREVAGHAVDLRVVQAVGRQLVIGGEPLEHGGALEDEIGLVGGTGWKGQSKLRQCGAAQYKCTAPSAEFRHCGSPGDDSSVAPRELMSLGPHHSVCSSAGRAQPARYFRRQRPTPPADPPHLAPVPCRVADPSLQMAETRTSPSPQETTSPEAST